MKIQDFTRRKLSKRLIFHSPDFFVSMFLHSHRNQRRRRQHLLRFLYFLESRITGVANTSPEATHHKRDKAESCQDTDRHDDWFRIDRCPLVPLLGLRAPFHCTVLLVDLVVELNVTPRPLHVLGSRIATKGTVKFVLAHGFPHHARLARESHGTRTAVALPTAFVAI